MGFNSGFKGLKYYYCILRISTTVFISSQKQTIHITAYFFEMKFGTKIFAFADDVKFQSEIIFVDDYLYCIVSSRSL